MSYAKRITPHDPVQLAPFVDGELQSISAELGPIKMIAPALQNAWVNYGAPYDVIGFYKLRDRVYIEGMIKSGTVTLGTLIFTLPKTYRPAKDLAFPVVTNNGAYIAGHVNVQADGKVVTQNVGNTFLSLSGIGFVARQ